MGRPRTPTALKLVNGNPGKRATNKQEPDAEYVQDLTPPDRLSEAAKEVWRDLAPRLSKAKVFTVLDIEPLEFLCNAIVDYRKARAKVEGAEVLGAAISPWAQLQSMHFKQANIGFRTFGMGPEARSRVMVNPQLPLFGGGGDGGDDGQGDKSKKYFEG